MVARAGWLGVGVVIGARLLALVGLVLVVPVPARADVASERRLRAVETVVLGPAHAREHAVARVAPPFPAATQRRGLRTAAPPPLEKGGRWNGRFALPVMAIHAALLPTGKVMLFAYPKEPSSGDGTRVPESWAALWDPADGSSRRVDPPIDPATGRPANIWCGGQSLLPDGRLLVTGGTLAYRGEGRGYAGLDRVFTFDPFAERWVEQPRMGHGRWYPSQLLLPDGRTLILQGRDESGRAPNLDLELFVPTPQLDGVGSLVRFGVLGGATGPPVGGLYPHTFWLPSGRGLVAGPLRVDAWFLHPPGDPPALNWAPAPRPTRNRRWSTAVLLPGGPEGSGRVLLSGGGATAKSRATRTTEGFDERRPEAGWVPQGSLRVQRGHHNTVLLPDGSMVTVGGGLGYGTPSDGGPGGLWGAQPEHRHVELWDPATGRWRLGPEQIEKRAYHSTALLLPDGRVLSAGDDKNGGFDTDTGELYEPPYLFRGPRPTIASAPTSIAWGERFVVGTPDARVARAVLVAPGATTHATDMSQRLVPLALTPAEDGVKLAAPRSPDIAPPGHYMLFLLDARGVPSVARFVRLGAPGDAAP